MQEKYIWQFVIIEDNLLMMLIVFSSVNSAFSSFNTVDYCMVLVRGKTENVKKKSHSEGKEEEKSTFFKYELAILILQI